MRVNSQPIGTVWHALYRVDIGTATRRGRNRIEVRVANLWVDRLIGDAQPDAVKTTFISLSTYRANSPMRRCGRLG